MLYQRTIHIQLKCVDQSEPVTEPYELALEALPALLADLEATGGAKHEKLWRDDMVRRCKLTLA